MDKRRPEAKMIFEFTDVEKEAIDYVIAYAGETSTDWFVIKVQLIKIYPPFYRKKFSKRHPGSLKFFVNDYERTIMSYWKETTGIDLIIDDSRLHSPADWPNNPKGWGLIRFNNERKEKKAQQQKP